MREELTEHQIHSTNDRHSISQQVTLGNVIKSTQVSETGSTNMASVRSLTAVRNDVDTHLTLRGLDSGVSLTRRDGVTLGVEQEVVNEGLHVLLHGSSWGRRNLVVLDTDRTSRHLVETLVDNAEGLAELLHSAEVSVVAVTVGSNRDIELNLVVGVVGLVLADVEGDSRTSEHDTSEGKVQSLGSRNDTNTPQSLNPDTVVGQHLLGLVDSVAELGSPLVNVVEKTNGDILVNTTGSDVGSVETGTGNTLVEFLHLSVIAVVQLTTVYLP
jgi:hypothetical protein